MMLNLRSILATIVVEAEQNEDEIHLQDDCCKALSQSKIEGLALVPIPPTTTYPLQPPTTYPLQPPTTYPLQPHPEK